MRGPSPDPGHSEELAWEYPDIPADGEACPTGGKGNIACMVELCPDDAVTAAGIHQIINAINLRVNVGGCQPLALLWR